MMRGIRFTNMQTSMRIRIVGGKQDHGVQIAAYLYWDYNDWASIKVRECDDRHLAVNYNDYTESPTYAISPNGYTIDAALALDLFDSLLLSARVRV